MPNPATQSGRRVVRTKPTNPPMLVSANVNIDEFGRYSLTQTYVIYGMTEIGQYVNRNLFTEPVFDFTDNNKLNTSEVKKVLAEEGDTDKTPDKSKSNSIDWLEI